MIAIPNMEQSKKCDDCPLCGYDERQSILFCRLDNEDIEQDLRDDCPLIDIVRCGECKYMSEHYDTDGNLPFLICLEWDSGTDIDGYCYLGERRADEPIT